jgi:cobalamin biosynthesis Mg chelatase CobN
MSKTLFEELSEFTDELVILLKEDWEKTKKFVREHKHYFFWLCALFIGSQITDIMTLGKSWDAYCKKNVIQNGGSSATATATVTEAPETATTPATAATPAAATAAAKVGTDTANAKAKASEAKATDAKANADAKAKASEADTKNTKKDGKKKGITKSIGDSLKKNPVFGNMNHIFSMTTSMFSLVLFLLAIVGILSLPVILFIIITYCVIKSLLNRLAIL